MGGWVREADEAGVHKLPVVGKEGCNGGGGGGGWGGALG